MDSTQSMVDKILEPPLRPPLRLIILSLIAIILFLLLGALSETYAEQDRLIATAMNPTNFVIDDPENGPFCLYVAHPLRLLVGEPSEVTAPIAIALTAPTSIITRSVPISVNTSISTVTTIQQDVYDIRCDKAQQVVTATNGLTINTGLSTYAITLEVGPSLTIVGGENSLPLPRALYDLGFSASPAGSMQIAHIRQANPAPWYQTTGQINISVADRNGNQQLGGGTLLVQQEPFVTALLRSAYIGFRQESIVIVIALLPTYGAFLATFFINQRRKRKYIEQNRGRIDHLRSLFEQNSAKFIEEYRDLLKKVTIAMPRRN